MRRLSRVTCSWASRRSRASSAESSPRSKRRTVSSSASSAQGMRRPTRLARMRSSVTVTTPPPRRRGADRPRRETRERATTDARRRDGRAGRPRRDLAMGRIEAALVLALQDRMGGDQRAVFEDAHLPGVALHLDDPLPRGVGDRVEVAPDRHHSLVAHPPLDRQNGAVAGGGMRDQSRLLLGEVLGHGEPSSAIGPRTMASARGGVDAGVGDRAPPRVELAVEVGHGEPWSRHRSEAHGERRSARGRSPGGRSGRGAPPCPWSWRGTGGRRGGSRRSGSGARRARCCR